ncbi:hypothetical protein HJO_16170 [Hyphomonas johnsonii MHS-2]|uniref:Uncharacterized protein n=1 Tax=Hyphomonas johnsonii MHS-2 TaxID=1280950 RepID=A0A059FBK0_9PROT|nr:hypothetical protein HJO_16170 [Hyphomonas johnsonii MHS-2]
MIDHLRSQEGVVTGCHQQGDRNIQAKCSEQAGCRPAFHGDDAPHGQATARTLKQFIVKAGDMNRFSHAPAKGQRSQHPREHGFALNVDKRLAWYAFGYAKGVAAGACASEDER